MGNVRERARELKTEILDFSKFEQLLDMDEGENDREYSYGIVLGFLTACKDTMPKLSEAIDIIIFPDIAELSKNIMEQAETLGAVQLMDSAKAIFLVAKNRNESGEHLGWTGDKRIEKIKADYPSFYVAYQLFDGAMRDIYSSEAAKYGSA